MNRLDFLKSSLLGAAALVVGRKLPLNPTMKPTKTIRLTKGSWVKVANDQHAVDLANLKIQEDQYQMAVEMGNYQERMLKVDQKNIRELERFVDDLKRYLNQKRAESYGTGGG